MSAEIQKYVGVSGVVNQDQQAELEFMWQDSGLSDMRSIQHGVKATHKPQYLGTENRHGREWYPVGREIDTALEANDLGTVRSMRVAQVCFDESQVSSTEYRSEFLARVLSGGVRKWLTGVQFDMLPDWCDDLTVATKTLEATLLTCESQASQVTLAIQCQSEIMNTHTPFEIARSPVLMLTDYLLFDASGGRGLRMNTDKLMPYIEAVYNMPALENIQVVIGGGLNAEVVRTELPKILRYFPDISWDAEGQLHPLNEYGKRPLDMQACKDYIEASVDVLR